jgi:thiamine biosynthesis lipoprotein ApbE
MTLNKFWTFFELYIIDKFDDINLENDINELFKNYENIFSRFKENSELSLVNKENRGDLSPLFLSLFKKNIELNQITNWYFNPFIDVEGIWYSNKKINIRKSKLDKISFEGNFYLDSNELILKNNTKIDFWGSWKWYFVDYASKYLIEKWFKNYFINFWWDIYISWKKDLNTKWRVWIENPFLKGEKIWYIDLEDNSISSSWNYLRAWEIDWDKFHHIINPKNNSNENEIKMVTIISDETYFSDSIATAVFNMWISEAISFLNNKNIDGLIIWANAKAYFSKWFIKIYNFSKNY